MTYKKKGDAIGFAKANVTGRRDDAVRKAREAIDKWLNKHPADQG